MGGRSGFRAETDDPRRTTKITEGPERCLVSIRGFQTWETPPMDNLVYERRKFCDLSGLCLSDSGMAAPPSHSPTKSRGGGGLGVACPHTCPHTKWSDQNSERNPLIWRLNEPPFPTPPAPPGPVLPPPRSAATMASEHTEFYTRLGIRDPPSLLIPGTPALTRIRAPHPAPCDRQRTDRWLHGAANSRRPHSPPAW